MKRLVLIASIYFLLGLTGIASAGIITGTLQSANGIPLKNGTMGFNLTQAGLLSGTGAIVPTTVYCYTSIDGSVVGLPNPLAPPVAAVNSGSGSLPGGNYYIKLAFYDAAGHTTLVSPELVVNASSGGNLIIQPPINFPTLALGMNVYIGLSSGSETLQGTTSSPTAAYTRSTAITSGSSITPVNNTICSLYFNDQIIPYAGYNVSLVSSSGKAYPGYPQSWQLNGGANGTVNISNGAPLWNGTVVYPMPILSQPLNHGPQSISGPLNMTGYNLTNVGKLGVGTANPIYSVDVENGTINTNTGYLINGSGGMLNYCLASDGSSFDTSIACAPSQGTWQRNGTIIFGASTTQFAAQEPSLIIDTNPQLIVGSSVSPIFKLWYTCGWTTEALCYAESQDGMNWTQAAGPVIASGNPVSHGQVFKLGSTYYFYAGNSATSSTSFSQWTSTDGINWNLVHANVINQGTGAQWDAGPLGNIYVFPNAVGSTWYAMYEGSNTSTGGLYISGVATSPDGVTWTKYAGNPVIGLGTGQGSGAAGGAEIHLINSLFYAWGQCSSGNFNEPTDICRWSSPDFLHWTINNSAVPVLNRMTNDEGLNSTGGQVADPSMVQVGSATYMVYDAVGTQGTPTENNNGIHLKLAIAPYTFAQLIASNEGNGGISWNNGTFNELHLQDCVNWNNGFSSVIPCVNQTGRFDIGSLNFIGNLDPQMCFNCYYDGTTTRYIANGGAAQMYMLASTGRWAVNIAPVGTSGSSITFSEALGASSTGGVQIAGKTISAGHLGATSCTTAASSYSTCTSTVTISPAQPDTSFIPVCSGATPSSGQAAVIGCVPASVTTVTVTIATEGSMASNYSDLFVHAIHQ